MIEKEKTKKKKTKEEISLNLLVIRELWFRFINDTFWIQINFHVDLSSRSSAWKTFYIIWMNQVIIENRN